MSDNNSDSNANLAIEFSKKILDILDTKAKENGHGTTLKQLMEVYHRGAGDCENPCNEDCGTWAMARVHMFLRMKRGETIDASYKELDISELDISNSWIPSKEDFLKAEEDVKKHDLHFHFKDIDELYIEYKPLGLDWILTGD